MLRIATIACLFLLPVAVLAQEATELPEPPEPPFEPLTVSIMPCDDTCVRVAQTADEDGQTFTVMTEFATFDDLSELAFALEGMIAPVTLGDFFTTDQLTFINQNTCYQLTTNEELPVDDRCEAAQVFSVVVPEDAVFWQADPETDTPKLLILFEEEPLGVCDAGWESCQVGTVEESFDVSLYPILDSQLPGATADAEGLMYAASWTEAQDFCATYGYRLPTQKEWLALWSANLIRYPEVLMDEDFVTFEWTGTRVEAEDERALVPVQGPDAWGGKRTISALSFELYDVEAPAFITGRIYFRCVRPLEDLSGQSEG